MSDDAPAQFVRPLRVGAANNYPLTEAARLVREHRYPAQHLWGIDAMAAAGWQVDVLPYHPRPGRARLRRATLGSAHTQLAAWHSDADVLYAADQWSLAAVSLATRRPVVAVVHQPLGRHPLERSSVRHLAAAVCLSERVAAELVDAGVPSERVHVLEWGPDLGFPGYRPGGRSDGVVSVGKTDRDLGTLRAAMRGLDMPLTTCDRHVPFEDVLPAMRDAAVVAIPLANLGRLAGLTEIADALALAKPIVVTRSPYLDVDVDAIGCGISVPPGDAGAMRAALEKLIADPGLRERMGAAGRAYAERTRSSARFGTALCEVVRRAAG